MSKLHIIGVGKTKDKWLDQAIGEYLKRLQPWLTVEFSWVKDDKQLLKAVEKEPFFVCLDPAGVQMDSLTFAHYFQQRLEEGGGRLALVIGGPEGLPPALKQHRWLLSLSPMTFTHQCVRLVLIEQIYRAIEIHKGSGYHK